MARNYFNSKLLALRLRVGGGCRRHGGVLAAVTFLWYFLLVVAKESTMNIMNEELQAIVERNQRVETDKDWETSVTRRTTIAVITYCTATFFFWINELPIPFLQGFIPTGGFLLSTLTLGPIKQWWLKHQTKKDLQTQL